MGKKNKKILLEWAERQEQLYDELQKYEDTWGEVLQPYETKEDWLLAELYEFIKLIKENA